MSEENEETVLEHDWLLAQFTVKSGALLAVILGLLIGMVANQVPWTPGVLLIALGSALLFYVWVNTAAKSEELRARLKTRKTPKER